MSLKQRWICTFILVLAQVAVSFGDEIVPIGKILTNAPSFADHLATFRGVVVRLERLPRMLTKSCLAQDRYHAVIEDSSGSIDAWVCGMLNDGTTIVQGDTVVIRAVILVTQRNGITSDVGANAVRMERAIGVPQ